MSFRNLYSLFEFVCVFVCVGMCGNMCLHVCMCVHVHVEYSDRHLH